jgi:hypothetical protein
MNVDASIVADGVVEVRIRTAAYPMVGLHWRQQLTGSNAAKWGRIFVDPSKEERRTRRRGALHSFGDLYRGEVGNNLDECPGAMFVWETNRESHVQPCDARSNQDLGRDLHSALRRVISGPMGWWEVRFVFD